jgi:hypothetical protein
MLVLIVALCHSPNKTKGGFVNKQSFPSPLNRSIWSCILLLSFLSPFIFLVTLTICLIQNISSNIQNYKSVFKLYLIIK